MGLINLSKLMKWIKMKGFINNENFKVFNIQREGGGRGHLIFWKSCWKEKECKHMILWKMWLYISNWSYAHQIVMSYIVFIPTIGANNIKVVSYAHLMPSFSLILVIKVGLWKWMVHGSSLILNMKIQ